MKKVYLFFIMMILLTMLIQVNCFADTIPDPYIHEDMMEYWVIMKYSNGRYYQIESRVPIVITIDEQSGEEQLKVSRTYKMYEYYDNEWVWYKTASGEENEKDFYKFENLIYSSDKLTYEDGSLYLGNYKIISSEISANVNIVMPRDGFIDNSSIFTISVITEFNRYLTDEEINNLRIDIELNGGPVNGEVIYNKMTKTMLYSVNELSFYVEVPEGDNEVEVLYYYNDILLGSDSVTFTRLLGFVDEDGDGLDDRTGREDNNKIEYDPDIDIDDSVSGMIKFLRNSVEGIRSVANVIKVTFSFLPKQVMNAFTGIIMVAIVIGIWRLIRG